ncbi:MAG: hypothetical protein K0S38_1053, partial [Candidatus Paceibacter sp.]|nr:hypothetical protein [Candidatus Paceibacter sp.]
MSTLAAILTASYEYPLYIKIIIALMGGVIPILVWLWFWEHEDKYPEPKYLVILAFVAGMLAVFAALFLEAMSCSYLLTSGASCAYVPPTYIFILWAAIEELLKFSFAYVTVLTRIENDEPIDSMMYMITVALGFAALENALFIFTPLSNNESILNVIISNNQRFIGATLLHTIASGVIGIALALSFYKSKGKRRLYVTIGVITAIVLHAFFNLSIMNLTGSQSILPFYG